MYFTKTQQKAIIFIAVIFTLMVAHHFINQFLHPAQPFDFSKFEEKFHSRADSIKNILHQKDKVNHYAEVNEDSTPITSSAGGLININSADLNELTRLPRIGPVIAQRIIDYRNGNGRYASKQDIKKVKGIGEKTYKELETLISVD